MAPEWRIRSHAESRLPRLSDEPIAPEFAGEWATLSQALALLRPRHPGLTDEQLHWGLIGAKDVRVWTTPPFGIERGVTVYRRIDLEKFSIGPTHLVPGPLAPAPSAPEQPTPEQPALPAPPVDPPPVKKRGRKPGRKPLSALQCWAKVETLRSRGMIQPDAPLVAIARQLLAHHPEDFAGWEIASIADHLGETRKAPKAGPDKPRPSVPRPKLH